MNIMGILMDETLSAEEVKAAIEEKTMEIATQRVEATHECEHEFNAVSLLNDYIRCRKCGKEVWL